MFIHARSTDKGYTAFTTNVLHAIFFRCDTVLCIRTGNRLAFRSDDGWVLTTHADDNTNLNAHIQRLVDEAKADVDNMD